MIAIIVMAALTALVWMVAALARGGPLAGALLVLLAGVCFGYPFFHLDAGPIPLTSDRVLFAVLLAQCLAWRRWGWTESRPVGKPEILLAAFVTVLVASTFSHDWHYQHNVPASRLLFYYLMPAGMYWVARQIPLDERSARLVFGSMAIFGVYLSLTALAEALRLHELVFPSYIASGEYWEFLGRARGPLLNPAANGYLLAVGFGAALMWWPRLNRRGQLILLGLAALFCAALYATLTRCVWLGGVALMCVIAALTLPKSWRLPLLGGVMVAGALVAATQWEKLMSFKRDEGHGAEETAESVELRPILALVAWKMFLQEPLFGCGFGHYRERFVDVLDDRDSELPLDKSRRYVQHNVWLGLLTETGLAGTALFTLLVGYWLRDAWRLWRSSSPLWARQFGLLFLATFASYVCNAMFQDLAIVPMINMILFFLAGLTAALRPATADQRAASEPVWSHSALRPA
ncbi:MAG TPA: O-antigen ligase family protein [Pirellulales bacterium]|nr:O-antigen ligase family protein [Pirellulales bacterium]